MTVKIINADVMDGLRQLENESVHCVVTSPPYFGLRDYGHAGQIGLEATPDEYITKMVSVFREVRRVLRSDGTLWLNIGDSYAGSWGAQSRGDDYAGGLEGGSILSARQITAHPKQTQTGSLKRTPGCKPKDLIGIPWMLAFALRADGWWLRQDIIWNKPNPMPESVTDRCTKAHEYVFLLTKSARYFYDADAVKEPAITGDERRPYGSEGSWKLDGRPAGARPNGRPRQSGQQKKQDEMGQQLGGYLGSNDPFDLRNKRSVWTIATQPFSEAHFATMAPELAETCIKAGCPKGGTVLDPFGGAGTTGLVADRLQRNAVLIELNPEYAAMAERRINTDRGDLLNFMEAAE